MSRETLLDEAIAKAKEAEDWQLVEWLRQARGAESAARWYTEKLRNANQAIRKLNTKNAKLHELVGDLREYIAGNADACDFCPQLGTCENHPAPPTCKYELTGRDHAVLDFIADSLSELGVPE